MHVGAFVEKSPTLTFASLESHKIGGIVRLPREIDEQSIVAMGQFLARTARSNSPALKIHGVSRGRQRQYEPSGIVANCARQFQTVVLAATKPAERRDARGLRNLRTKVNKSALNGAALSVLHGQHVGNAIAELQDMPPIERVSTVAGRPVRDSTISHRVTDVLRPQHEQRERSAAGGFLARCRSGGWASTHAAN